MAHPPNDFPDMGENPSEVKWGVSPLDFFFVIQFFGMGIFHESHPAIKGYPHSWKTRHVLTKESETNIEMMFFLMQEHRARDDQQINMKQMKQIYRDDVNGRNMKR